MRRVKVFLTGGDNIGWALDEDLKLTCSALERIVEFTDLPGCDVVHSVWWEGLLRLPKEHLIGKRIICHVSGEPRRYLGMPQHRHAVPMVGLWIVRSAEAARQLTEIGMTYRLIPYTVNLNTFHPLPFGDPRVEALRAQWAIPRAC